MLGFSVAEEGVVRFQDAGALGVGDDGVAALQGQDDDVVIAETGFLDCFAFVGAAFRDVDVCDGVAAADGEALADVDVGEFYLIRDVVDDFAGDVEAGCSLDAFEAGGGIDFHDLGAVLALEHVDAADAQTHDLGGADGGFLVGRLKGDALCFTSAVDVGAEFLALGDAAYGCYDAVSDDEGADVLAFAFGNEFLKENLLLGGVEGLDDGFCDLNLIREDDADALGAFEELDDDWCAADAHEGVFDVALVIDVSGGGDADIVAGEDLEGAEFVAGVADSRSGVWGEDVHLLELADDGCAVAGDGGADAGEDGIGFLESLSAVVKIRISLIQADGEAEGVENLDLMATFFPCLDEAACGVALGRAGEDGKFHMF